MSVNEKSTKAEILEALKQAEAKIQQLQSAKFDPVAEAAQKKVAATVTKADTVVEEGIEALIASFQGNITKAFDLLRNGATDVVANYKTVSEAIAAKEAELKELYGIEKEAASLAALIESKKAIAADYDERLQAKIDEANEELQEIRDNARERRAQFDAELREYKASVEKDRKREVEEYNYNLKRERQLEQDAWEDEKKKWSAELDERQENIQERESEVAAREEKMDELEAKVASIPTTVQEAVEKAVKDAEKSAATAKAIEINYLKKDHAGELKEAAMKASILENDNARMANEIADLKEKLNNAYSEIKEMAGKMVESAGNTKMVNSLETIIREQSGKNQK